MKDKCTRLRVSVHCTCLSYLRFQLRFRVCFRRKSEAEPPVKANTVKAKLNLPQFLTETRTRRLRVKAVFPYVVARDVESSGLLLGVRHLLGGGL